MSSDTDLMASGDFFAMLFGSMRFEEFVGELMISSLAREAGAIDGEKVRHSALLINAFSGSCISPMLYSVY